ncbi:hypothetical protein HRbin22_00218 [Candidatus Thermoflexus japonica]|uniref:H repeat-associated protein N-terminal domain-containing protein n=1 Tax=Candidatus Thermoflexus japonica TaxID=2035417 RepID=A0A2H5Y3L5_9CHLR|nr:hypothetical protein HRbin22_00218 [Candidatus Thermoflexus japonica]
MPQSLLDVLAAIPDPRDRHGRRYPIQSLLATLILAAMNGQASLRGMWLWARAHSDWLTRHLPFHRNRIPALETFRTLLCRLDLPLLLEVFNGWLTAVNAERISLDEKVLRGSKRDGEAPLMVVAAFGHRVGLVLGQVVAEGQDKTEAAMALLERMPLEGKVLTLDAGLMTGPVVRKVVEKGGATWDR